MCKRFKRAEQRWVSKIMQLLHRKRLPGYLHVFFSLMSQIKVLLLIEIILKLALLASKLRLQRSA